MSETTGAAAIKSAVSAANDAGGPPPDDDAAVNLELSKHPRNDYGNGLRFRARHGGDVLHVREVGWHYWNGQRWARDGGDGEVRKRAHETGQLVALEAIAVGEDDPGNYADRAEWSDLQESLWKWSVECGNRRRVDAMLTESAPYLDVDPDALDRDPDVLNLGNGTLRLEGACEDLQPHRREDRLAKIMPVDFDPEAECPQFLRFIHQVQPDEEVRGFLQRWVGYSLTGRIGEQKLVFNYGEGGNGKSVFVDIIARIMGPYSSTLPFQSLAKEDRPRAGSEASPDLARLPGARMVRVAEPEQGLKFAEAKVKAMTGGEPMIVRHLNRGFFEFMPQFKLTLSGNHKPSIQGQDRGIWRRFLLVPWEVNLEESEQDPDLPAKLWAERCGILNWMLDGVRMWLEDGLAIPDKVRAATDEYRADSDPLGRFITSCTVKASGSVTAAREMYSAYQRWCKANAERVWTQTSFGRGLTERGIHRDKVAGLVIYLDVKLVNVPDDDGEDPPPPDPDDYGAD